jgi:hypothetical protein
VAIFHWKTYEIIGREVWVLATTETRQAFKEAWRRVLESGKPVRRGPYYVEAVTKGGEPVPVEVVLSSWTEAAEAPGGQRRVFCASIRQRPRGPRGETAEDRVDLESMRAPPSPTSDLLRQAVSPPPGPGESTVGVQPSPDGGADIHVPPGAKAIVRQDGVGVEVDPSESKAPPPGPQPWGIEMAVPFTREEIMAWIRACSSTDALRQMLQTVNARLQDLTAAGQNAPQLQQPHVLIQK